jgi:hypothetical protein
MKSSTIFTFINILQSQKRPKLLIQNRFLNLARYLLRFPIGILPMRRTENAYA